MFYRAEFLLPPVLGIYDFVISVKSAYQFGRRILVNLELKVLFRGLPEDDFEGPAYDSGSYCGIHLMDIPIRILEYHLILPVAFTRHVAQVTYSHLIIISSLNRHYCIYWELVRSAFYDYLRHMDTFFVSYENLDITT